MEVIKVNLQKLTLPQVTKILKFLKSNKIVVLPTDTCYGLMGKATSDKVVKRIYKIKGRSSKKPLSCIFRDIAMIKKFTKLDKENERLIKKFLPGPITFILPKKFDFPPILTPHNLIGVRIPKNQLIAKIMQKINFPLTATSANLSGRPEPYSIWEIFSQYQNQIYRPDLIVDAGKLKKIKPSTVVMVKNGKVKILRHGPISQERIIKYLKKCSKK